MCSVQYILCKQEANATIIFLFPSFNKKAALAYLPIFDFKNK